MRINCTSVKVGAERFDAPQGAEVHQDGEELVVDIKKDLPRFMPGDRVDFRRIGSGEGWRRGTIQSGRWIRYADEIGRGGIANRHYHDIRHHFEPGDPVAFVNGGPEVGKFIRRHPPTDLILVAIPHTGEVWFSPEGIFPVRKPKEPQFKVGDVVRLKEPLVTQVNRWKVRYLKVVSAEPLILGGVDDTSFIEPAFRREDLERVSASVLCFQSSYLRENHSNIAHVKQALKGREKRAPQWREFQDDLASDLEELLTKYRRGELP